MKFLLTLKPLSLFLLIMIPIVIAGIYPALKFIGIIGIIVNILWLYSIGSIMRTFSTTINLFRISCLLILLTLITSELIDPFRILNNQYLFWSFLILLMSSCFYSIGFAAVMLESAKQGKRVIFNDSIKFFLGFWFFPVGIWYIQPVVKRLVDEQTLEISQ